MDTLNTTAYNLAVVHYYTFKLDVVCKFAPFNLIL